MLPQSDMLSAELLQDLEDHWRRQQAPLAERLQPGLTDAEIDELTAPLGIVLATEVRIWWGWHNGASPSDSLRVDREFGPGFVFLPLGEAIALYRQMRQIFRDIWEADDPQMVNYWWRPTWFPITERRGAVRCDCAVPPGAPTPIYWAYSHDHDAEGLTNPKVASFGTMVTWWLEALETGAWYYNASANRWEHQPELLPPERERSGLV